MIGSAHSKNHSINQTITNTPWAGESVVLALVAGRAVKGVGGVGLLVGARATAAAGTAQVAVAGGEGAVGGGGHVLAGVGVLGGEECGVGAQEIALVGQEGQSRLHGRPWRGGRGRGGGGGREQKEINGWREGREHSGGQVVV